MIEAAVEAWRIEAYSATMRGPELRRIKTDLLLAPAEYNDEGGSATIKQTHDIITTERRKRLTLSDHIDYA